MITVPETNEQLKELCSYWQRQLRLQDWEVTIRFARRIEMQRQNSWGQCMGDQDNKTAEILILDPKEFYDYDLGKREIEDSVVHELMHIPIEAVTKDTNNKNALEQLVHTVTAALVRLNKGERR